MIIAISGSVGAGKTTISKDLGQFLNAEVISLNTWTRKYKIQDVEEIQTYDFDIEMLMDEVVSYIKKNKTKNIIFESHFAHEIPSSFVDLLIVIGRPLEELKKEYLKRGYNAQKINDNLEVEAMNSCYFEAEELGYIKAQCLYVENNIDYEDFKVYLVKKVQEWMKKYGKSNTL